MVPFQKWVKIANENGTILVRKGSKLLNKNGAISEKGRKSSTKMVPFQERVKNPQQKWYHFRIGSIFLNKMVPFQAVKGQNSSTKMVPFQKRVKNYRQKWYHFSQKMIKIPQQKCCHFRKGSKILNKNGTMNKERRQDFHIKLLPWDKG